MSKSAEALSFTYDVLLVFCCILMISWLTLQSKETNRQWFTDLAHWTNYVYLMAEMEPGQIKSMQFPIIDRPSQFPQVWQKGGFWLQLFVVDNFCAHTVCIFPENCTRFEE